MTDTVLTLGDFAFARFEVPEKISGLGGEQALTVHRLVGGKRVVDAMGADPTPLDWSGIFVGQNALDRALYLDGLRRAGKPLQLTWSQYRYTVLIRRFECDFVRFYRLPYQISCEPVSDDTAPATGSDEADDDQLVTDDLASAGALSDAVGDGTLSGLMATLQTAAGGIGSFATASAAQIASVLLPLAAVRAQVATLISAADVTLGSVDVVGGVVPSAPLVAQVAALAAQTDAMTTLPSLVTLDRTLGRVEANLGAIDSGTRSVTVGGGNLLKIAAAQYGDAMGWTALAAANGLIDPEIAGIATILVPPYASARVGVLGGWPSVDIDGMAAAAPTAPSAPVAPPVVVPVLPANALTDKGFALTDAGQILVES